VCLYFFFSPKHFIVTRPKRLSKGLAASWSCTTVADYTVQQHVYACANDDDGVGMMGWHDFNQWQDRGRNGKRNNWRGPDGIFRISLTAHKRYITIYTPTITVVTVVAYNVANISGGGGEWVGVRLHRCWRGGGGEGSSDVCFRAQPIKPWLTYGRIWWWTLCWFFFSTVLYYIKNRDKKKKLIKSCVNRTGKNKWKKQTILV